MRKAVAAGFTISLFLIVGCAHVPFIGKPAPEETAGKSNPPAKAPSESSRFVKKGRIVDAQRLQKKQNIVIVPFKAGVSVVASEELDKIALMLVKGVSDAFAFDQGGKHAHFDILTAEDSREADLFIQGHVTDMKSSSKISRWVLFKGEKALGVDGRMVDARTGETVLIFTDQVKTEAGGGDYKLLGYRIGKNIGRFILSGVE